VKLLRATQAFFLLNATAMLAIGILTLIRPPQLSQGLTIFTAALMVIDAALLFGCAWVITRRQKWLNLGAVALLAANILLTVTDDFGLLDLVVLVLLITNLVFLLLTIRQSRQNL